MAKNIFDKNNEKVGTITSLEGGGYAIEFHDVYMGVFSSFEGWNAQHGLAYTLEGDSVMFEFDIELDDYNTVFDPDSPPDYAIEWLN